MRPQILFAIWAVAAVGIGACGSGDDAGEQVTRAGGKTAPSSVASAPATTTARTATVDPPSPPASPTTTANVTTVDPPSIPASPTTTAIATVVPTDAPAVEFLDVSEWIGLIVGREADSSSWEQVVVVDELVDLFVGMVATAPIEPGEHEDWVVWLVSGDPDAYSNIDMATDVMLWLIDPEGFVADALGLGLPSGVRPSHCWQANPTGPAWPLVIWVIESAWAVQPAPEFFSLFDIGDLNCSAS